MNPIKFLFKLVEQFSPMDDVEYHKLSQKGNDWYMGVLNAEEEPKNPALKLLKQHGNEWYTALFLGLLYIFAVKYISDMLHTKKYSEDEY